MTSAQTLLAGRYRLEEPIGQGGMGRVWLATDELLGRRTAVKELVPPAGLTPLEVEEMSARALREARAAARLSHTNVVGVYDVVVEGGTPWIVMEYVPSRSLHDLVARQGPLDEPTVARIGLGVLAALRTAHAAGILHRDVKPGNVLVADDGRVVLTDFGLATIVGDPAVTRSGVLIGSPSYLAPERAADGAIGPASDLWSLGATLYFAVEGHAPYERESALATITALATEDPPPPVRARALVPVISGLLRRAPESRLGPLAIERLLRQVLVPSRAGAPAPMSAPAAAPAAPAVLPPQQPRQPGPPLAATVIARAGRHRGWLGLALLVLVLAAGLGFWLIRPDGSPTPGVQPSTVETSAAASTTTAAGAPPATPDPDPSPSATGLVIPSGWHRYTDETGFSVAIPDGWRIERTGTIVYFREPGGSRYLGIDQTNQPQPDPVADWTGKEAYRVNRGDFPGYQRIRIEEVPYFQKAADWEFTYLVDGVRVHVLNRGFITAPDQAYGMWWSTSDSDWAASLDALRLIQDSFTPRS